MFKMWGINQSIVLIWLAVLAFQDVKDREISAVYLWGMSFWILSYLAYILISEEPAVRHILGIFIGVFFLAVSRITNEKLGYGDSIVLLFLAIYLGVWDFCKVGMLAFSMSFIYIIINLVIKKMYKHSRIAFLPFVLLGYVGGLVL